MTTDYPTLEILCRRAMRRHSLTERERLIAEVVLDFSYALSRPAAAIPRQDVFVTLTGITKGNVSAVLAGLESCGILHIVRVAGLYTFLPDSSTWRVRSRLPTPAHTAAADRTEDWLREVARISPEQLNLLPQLPDLTLLLAEDARETMSHTRSVHGGNEYPECNSNHGAEPTRDGEPNSSSNRERGACPRDGDSHASTASEFGAAVEEIRRKIGESLGADPPPKSSRIGNSQFPNRELLVPESGTPLNAFNVSSKNLQLNASVKAVPESGTEAELLRQIGDHCGPEAMRHWGGWWRMRIREHPVAVREALADLTLHRAGGRSFKKSPGHFLSDRYRRIAAEFVEEKT